MRSFNDEYASRGVRMRWRRKPHSELVIERFPVQGVLVGHPVSPSGGGGGGGGGGGAAAAAASATAATSGHEPVHAVATLVEDPNRTTR